MSGVKERTQAPRTADRAFATKVLPPTPSNVIGIVESYDPITDTGFVVSERGDRIPIAQGAVGESQLKGLTAGRRVMFTAVLRKGAKFSVAVSLHVLKH